MAVGSWVVSSVVRLQSSGFTSGMAAVARSTAMANERMLAQQGIITRSEVAMRRYKRSLDDANAAIGRFGTVAAGAGFAIGATALVAAVADAAKFERAMTGVQIATSATNEQFKKLSDMAFHVSGITAQSAVTIADEMKVAAQVAFKKPEDLMKIFPMMSKYADVRWIASGGKQDPTETVSLMSSYAHMFSAYGVTAMKNMLDLSAKLQMTTDTSLQQLVTQGRMYIPNASKLGVSMDEIMQYTAIMSQLGFMKGRGGTAMNNLILGAEGAVSPTATLSKAKRAGMQDLQMYDSVGRFRFVDEKGHLLLDKMVQHLQAMREQFERQNARFGGGRWMTDVGAAFGKEAQRLISVIADPQTRAQMDRNRTAFNNIPGVEGQWKSYGRDLFYEWNAFKTDIENIETALALPSLPDIEKGFHSINTQLLRLGDYFKQNPDIAKRYFEIGAAIVGGLGVRAVAGVLVGLNSVRTSLDTLAAASVRDAAIIGGAAGVLGGGGVGPGPGGGAPTGGFLSRIGGMLKNTFGWIDKFVFMSLGGVSLRFATKLATGFRRAVTAALDLAAASIRGFGALVFRRLFAHLGTESAAFQEAFWKDLTSGIVGAFRIIVTPLTNIKTDLWGFAKAVEMFAPGIVAGIESIGGALGGFVGLLGKLAASLEGGPLGFAIAVASMVLSGTPAGPSTADEDAAVRAFNANRGIGGAGSGAPVSIGQVHVHVVEGDDPHATGQAVVGALRSLVQHPLTLIGKHAGAATSGLLGNGTTVGGLVFGSP